MDIDGQRVNHIDNSLCRRSILGNRFNLVANSKQFILVGYPVLLGRRQFFVSLDQSVNLRLIVRVVIGIDVVCLGQVVNFGYEPVTSSNSTNSPFST